MRRARSWADLPLRWKGLAVVLIPLVPLMVISGAFYTLARYQGRVDAQVAHGFEFRGYLEHLLRLLVDAETGVRGYLLTNDRQWLEPYNRAVQGLDAVLAQLTQAALADPGHHADLDRLRGLVQLRLEVARDALDLSRVDAPTLAQVMTEGRRAMDEGRSLIRTMQAREDQQLAVLQQDAAFARSTVSSVTAVGLLLGLAGGIRATALFTTGVVSRLRVVQQNAEALLTGAPAQPIAGQDEVAELGHVLARVRTLLDELEAERQAKLEAMTRASAEIHDLYDFAPCGYHSVDAEGRIVRMNATELSWLGYTTDEVVGRMRFGDLTDDDGRRTFQENFPILIRTGQVTDLEFTLIRKDGSGFPVSLSATAVQDAGGQFLHSRSIVFDITGRKEAEQEVKALNQALERRLSDLAEAHRELEGFSYSVSHDLRAPLRHIAGFVDLLGRRSGPALDATGQRYLETITRAATAMGQLIDDLLVFSRMGREPLRMIRVDLAALAGEVIAATAGEAIGRAVEWRVAPLPAVKGDPALLRVVLVNLISNALKYSRPRSPAIITIDAAADAEMVTVSIRDNGVGFDMKYVDRLFGVFQRLHRAEDFEGTGIGLASVRRIVSRHGGLTWAEGEPDRGATIFFTLPVFRANAEGSAT